MTNFMDDFLKGEKTPEEKKLLAVEEAEKKHDVMRLDLSGFGDETEEDGDDVYGGGCASAGGGCGGCGCRS